MPIIEELKNLKKFESVGFSHEQAEALAETIEHAQASGYENLKEFIRTELDTKINGLRNELGTKINGLDSKINELRSDLRADIAISSKDLLIKIFAIIFGTSAMLFGMLKLFG